MASDSESVDSGILSAPAGRKGSESMDAFTVSVLWGPGEAQGNTKLAEFLDESHEDECQKTLIPSHYSFAGFQAWLSQRFGYNPVDHKAFFCRSFAELTYELESQADWVRMLTDVAARDDPMEFLSSVIYVVVGLRNGPDPLLFRLNEFGTLYMVDNGVVTPNGSLIQTATGRNLILDDIPSALESGTDEETSTPPSALALTPGTSSVSGPCPESPIVRPSSAASSLNKSEEECELVELAQDEYHVEEACDDDYGAVDNTTVDTYVGSFNTGNKAEEWDECLKFFAITRPVATKSTRVPFKKLPGMSVGLFDYQLMGVFNLLKLTLGGVAGGFLADEQGLGKTQEMFGLIALTYGLRRSKAEVLLARASPAKGNRQHNRPGSNARACFADSRYGFRCYCYHKLTQQLADLLPDGPSLIIVPGRNMTQTLREAKTKLDTSALKIRLQHRTVGGKDRLTASEAKSLLASVTAKEVPGDGEYPPTVEYSYKPKPNSSDFVIITAPESLDELCNITFGVDVKVAKRDKRVKRSGLLPGMVFMDEFHEYVRRGGLYTDDIVAWIQDLKASCRGPRQPVPLCYLVSGTPLGESPEDLYSPLTLLSQRSWELDSHPMADVIDRLMEVNSSYIGLVTAQAHGEVLDPADIVDYRRRLGAILKQTMVRRLGTDSFRGTPLTTLGPLSVNIVDHSIPDHLINNLQSLADATRTIAEEKAAAIGTDVSHLLRSSAGEDILLKLRLASTFPGIASPLPKGETFNFDLSEILSEMTAAGGNVAKTRYFPHLPRWATHSPKLATLDATVAAMVADKTRIPGENCHAKKLVVFAPLEAEALLLFAYLLHRKAKTGDTLVKPVWLHSGMTQGERQAVIDKFLELNNAAPNVLVAPIQLAGTGLNFQRCKYSVVTGPAWTKRENQQAYYRIHRIGQKQQTKLQLLTGRWNPAERLVLSRYAGREVEEGDLWEVGNSVGAGEGEGLVERHQEVKDEAE